MGIRVPVVMEPDATRPPRLAVLVLAGLAVVTASVWAFTLDSEPTSGEPGVRRDPGDVYDPVAAGEKLPAGFRQLLPRDGIRPVYDPEFVVASESGWPPDTDVIGVAWDGEAKAYPVEWLNGREAVIDRLAGIPILVTW